MYQTSSDCAVMTETAAINKKNFSFADLALDKISLAIVLYTHGITYQPTVLTFQINAVLNADSIHRFQQDTLLFITFRLFYIATHCCFCISISLFYDMLVASALCLLIIIIIS